MSKPIKEANPSNFYSKSSSVIREKYGNKSLGKGDITRLVNPGNIIEKKLKPSEDKLKLVIDKIESSDKKLQALGELKSIVNAMIDANNKLINNYPNNVFSQKTSELSTDDILSASDYLKVSTNSTAITDSYNVSVKQLAQKAILMVGENSNTDNTLDGFNNQDQAFKATKITVTVSDLNTPIDIDLNSNDTLVNIISKINNNQTLMSKNISARILSFPDNTGSSKYYLELVRNDTGQYKIDVDFTFDNNVSTFAKNIKEGTNAKFIINGSAASESNSNKLEIAKGITIEAIRKNSDGNSQNIIIKNDVEAAKSGIINLFNAWNKYAEFSAKQYEKNGNNEFVDTAYLGGSSVLRTVNPMFQNFFSSNSGFNYATLGFELSKTEGNGPVHKEFIYNNTTLERMLNNNFEDVMLLFKGEGSIVIDPISDSTNSEIKFSPNSKNPTNFSDGVKFDLAIQVEADGTVYVAYDLEGTENLESAEETENLESAHYNNITNIISFEGTKLEGIEFYYKNNESNKLEVYNVKLFQGISEKFAKNLDSIINKQTSNGIQKGAIDREISKLISEKTLLQKQEEETQKILDAKIAKIDLEFKKVQLKQTQLDADFKIFKNLSSN